MIKAIIISDTHSQSMPDELYEAFKGVDYIIHAGDFSDVSVLNDLRQYAEVIAVAGNTDGSDVRAFCQDREVFQFEDVNIGLMHGFGAPGMVPNHVENSFRGKDVDIVIFGHSHFPLLEQRDGFVLFNPGSPTDIVRAPYRSYGKLTVDGKDFKLRHMKIKDAF